MDSISTRMLRSDLPRPDFEGSPQSSKFSQIVNRSRISPSSKCSQSPHSSAVASTTRSPEVANFEVQDPPAARVARRSRRSIDASLIELAKRQFGVITASQLGAVGINRKSIQARVDSGMLVRLFPNVVRLAQVPVSAEQQFLAAALSVPGSAISGRSAAFVHGFPTGTLRALLLDDQGKVDVELSVLRKCVTEIKGIKARRCRRSIETQPWKGVRVTTIPQTVADLASILPAAELSMLLDHLLVKRLTKVADIRKVVLKNDRMVNRQQLLAVLDRRSEDRMVYRSRLEYKVGGWLNDLGAKRFQPNYLVAEAGGVEVDFAWRSHRVVLEVSPFYTHGAERTQERDMIRRRKLLAAGWLVFEVTDVDLVSKEAFALAIASLLELLLAPGPA
jgi:hypothetical protein